ncbi:MAG: bifunctional UDP-N-acetylglucosamine diphosphorylase/glucosamine-1-phosphate N-acetyltransferase GlmU [Firmicutes bacterium]|nr:bifunctional UDP-N-acetylglucosamine diphosphorylase/glucosamine-1-phosphate N-acetyltransferase GlmU [Bacillota bacterium]
MEHPRAVILAAGEGTRMKSSLPKVLHPLCGKPLLWYIVQSAKAVTSEQLLVVGHGAGQVKEYFGDEFLYVSQKQRLGTGHALQQTLPHLPAEGEMLVLCGDTPLLEKEVLRQLILTHRRQKAAATILTARMDDPGGYGRIIRSDQGKILKIVEELHLTLEQKKVQEINTGTYCFDLRALKKFLPLLPQNLSKGEYYLTDLIPVLLENGLEVGSYIIADAEQALGINDRLQLARAASRMRERINSLLMRAGVAMIDPATTYIDAGVEIGKDTIIYPQTILEGDTKVGENCLLGPGLHLVDTLVGNEVVCRQSVVLESVLKDGVNIGPYAHIRPGSTIGAKAKIGGFVEVKNSSIGTESKVPHLSYVGDTKMGPDVNVGAGSIVVNYDGRRKHVTNIGEGAFIGCNSNLIAPLNIGDGAFIAAGSTVTRDVPSGSLAISRAKQKVKEGLAQKLMKKKQNSRKK